MQASQNHEFLRPRHLLGQKTDFNLLSLERFKEIVFENTEPLTTERYPGYKRGSKSFADEEKLERHQQYHEASQYFCPHCGKNFKELKHLNYHVKNRHPK